MNPYAKISLNIIAVFAIMMLVSFIPEYLVNFLGDWHCSGGEWIKVADNSKYIGCDYGGGFNSGRNESRPEPK